MSDIKLIMENWKRFLKENENENDNVVQYIINATRAGLSPDEITQGLVRGKTLEQALEALSQAFQHVLPGEEVEIDLD